MSQPVLDASLRTPGPLVPIEVLTRILEYAVEAPSDVYIPHAETLPPRYAQLRAFSLAAKQWRTSAQALLWRDVWLPLPLTAYKFTGATEAGNWTLSRSTRTLRLGREWREEDSDFNQYGGMVQRVLLLVPYIRELWLSECRIDPAVLSWAQDLRALHLNEVTLRFPETSGSEDDIFTWYLPHLETLWSVNTHIQAPKIQLAASDRLFTPLALPALTKLAFSWHHRVSGPCFEQIAPQLDTLALWREGRFSSSRNTRIYPNLPPALFERLESIDHLSLNVIFDNEVYALANLASALITLHLHGRNSDFEEQLVVSVVPIALHNLEVLFLPTPPVDDLDVTEDGRLIEPDYRVKVKDWIESAEVVNLDLPSTMAYDESCWCEWIRKLEQFELLGQGDSEEDLQVSEQLQDTQQQVAGQQPFDQQAQEYDGFVEDDDDDEVDGQPIAA